MLSFFRSKRRTFVFVFCLVLIFMYFGFAGLIARLCWSHKKRLLLSPVSICHIIFWFNVICFYCCLLGLLHSWSCCYNLLAKTKNWWHYFWRRTSVRLQVLHLFWCLFYIYMTITKQSSFFYWAIASLLTRYACSKVLLCVWSILPSWEMSYSTHLIWLCLDLVEVFHNEDQRS